MTFANKAIIERRCNDGCRLNKTTSPSIKCRSTISPNYNENSQHKGYSSVQQLRYMNSYTVREL